MIHYILLPLFLVVEIALYCFWKKSRYQHEATFSRNYSLTILVWLSVLLSASMLLQAEPEIVIMVFAYCAIMGAAPLMTIIMDLSVKQRTGILNKSPLPFQNFHMKAPFKALLLAMLSLPLYLH